MKNKNLGDVIISGAVLALCAFFCVESSGYAYEVKVFPRLFLIILALTSLGILIRAVMAYTRERRLAAAEKAAGAAVEEYDDKGTDLKPVILQMLPFIGLLFILAYIICIQFIGFFVSTAIFMLAFMRFLQMKKWWLMVAITVGVEIFIYLAFVLAFAIRLPAGILF